MAAAARLRCHGSGSSRRRRRAVQDDGWGMGAQMEGLSVVASVLYQFGTNAAFLLLCALGLIVILGMMNIINLAHGELMMMGAYTATAAYHRGVPFPLSVVLAFVAVAIFGAVLERLIV